MGYNVLARLPDSLCLMTTLKSLRLEKNKIEHLPDTLGDLVRLEELVLRDNTYSGASEEHLRVEKAHEG